MHSTYSKTISFLTLCIQCKNLHFKCVEFNEKVPKKLPTGLPKVLTSGRTVSKFDDHCTNDYVLVMFCQLFFLKENAFFSFLNFLNICIPLSSTIFFKKIVIFGSFQSQLIKYTARITPFNILFRLQTMVFNNIIHISQYKHTYLYDPSSIL